MDSSRPFTVDKVVWHTQRPGTNETLDQVSKRFRAMITFLQDNGLTTRQVLSSRQRITDETAILSTDLTEVGLALMRKCYDKWLQKVDAGLDPEDISLFEKQLAKLEKK